MWAELEQQLSALQLQYALLDALWAQCDQREAMLASEYEVVHMRGKQLSPRLSRRQA